jgi:predicted GNAT superfamily acetyltransferase
MTFTIRDLESYSEMLVLRQLQREIWGLDEPDFGLYPPFLYSAAKNGGMVLGAFDDNTGQMIGFLFGFLGREPGGPLKLCSQTMGVLPAWRGQDVAEALKQTQRERVIAQGLPLITWTFDPLEGPNAQLNLHKLRAISRTYWRDMYGSHFGALNAGLPTDRLLVEWWVNGQRAKSGAAQAHQEGSRGADSECSRRVENASHFETASIFEVAGKDVERRITQSHLNLDAARLQLEIPADLHRLKAADLALAFDWRLKVRQAFETYFDKGYLATGFSSTFEQGERRNSYLLENSTPNLLAEIGIEESI